MVAENTDRGEWSCGKSLLLKIGILGISVVAALWVGWPQPPIVHHDRVSSVPVSEQLSVSQLSSAPSADVSTINGVQRSAVEGEAKIFQPADRSVLIDLNLGSRSELESLPGIGRKLADRIVSYRSIHGTFNHVDDVVKVSGIGKKRLQRLEPFVTVKARIEKRAS